MESSIRKNYILALCLGACALLGGVLIVNAVAEARRTMWLKQTRNDLKWIAIALYQYHDRYGSFPPVVIQESNEAGLHSWRSLVQTHLAEIAQTKDIFSGYTFAEPWNSERNQASATSHRFGNHPYQFLAVVGPHAAWGPDGTRSIKDMSDGTSNTIFAIAMRNTGVRWNEPVDAVATDDGTLSVNGRPLDLSSDLFILLVDGSVRYAAHGIDRNTLSALLTIDAGDTVREW